MSCLHRLVTSRLASLILRVIKCLTAQCLSAVTSQISDMLTSLYERAVWNATILTKFIQ